MNDVKLIPGAVYDYKPQRQGDRDACKAVFIAVHPYDGACVIMEPNDDMMAFFTCDRSALAFAYYQSPCPPASEQDITAGFTDAQLEGVSTGERIPMPVNADQARKMIALAEVFLTARGEPVGIPRNPELTPKFSLADGTKFESVDGEPMELIEMRKLKDLRQEAKRFRKIRMWFRGDTGPAGFPGPSGPIGPKGADGKVEP